MADGRLRPDDVAQRSDGMEMKCGVCIVPCAL